MEMENVDANGELFLVSSEGGCGSSHGEVVAMAVIMYYLDQKKRRIFEKLINML